MAMADAVMDGAVRATTIDGINKKVALRILPFLVLGYIVAFIDRANIGFGKLAFTSQLGFNETIYGLGAGIFYLGYILLEVPSNLYLNKVGVRKTFLRIMVLWGLACAAIAYMTQPSHFYILRFLLGAAEAGLFPGVLLYLTFWVPRATRARVTAIFMASIPIAGMLGGPLAGLLMREMEGVGDMRGWQWLFIIEGLPAILLGVLAYFYLDDKPKNAKWLSDSEKTALISEIESEQIKEPGVKPHPLSALKDVHTYVLAAPAFSLMVSTAGIFLWMPTVIRRAGIEDTAHIGLLSVIPFFVGFVVQFLNGRHSDKTGERRWHAAVSAVVGAAGWALLPLMVSSAAGSILCLTIATAGTFGAMGPFWSLPQTLLSPAKAPAGIALVSTLAGFGNFISPIIVGWLADETGSLAAGQYYYAVLLVIGGVAVVSKYSGPRGVQV
jgi:MFS family permease